MSSASELVVVWKRAIPKVTQKMLTQQLRELESDGVIHREVYPVVPPKLEYSLTDYGKTLIPIIEAIAAWGVQHAEYVGEQVKS